MDVILTMNFDESIKIANIYMATTAYSNEAIPTIPSSTLVPPPNEGSEFILTNLWLNSENITAY